MKKNVKIVILFLLAFLCVTFYNENVLAFSFMKVDKKQTDGYNHNSHKYYTSNGNNYALFCIEKNADLPSNGATYSLYSGNNFDSDSTINNAINYGIYTIISGMKNEYTGVNGDTKDYYYTQLIIDKFLNNKLGVANTNVRDNLMYPDLWNGSPTDNTNHAYDLVTTAYGNLNRYINSAHAAYDDYINSSNLTFTFDNSIMTFEYKDGYYVEERTLYNGTNNQYNYLELNIGGNTYSSNNGIDKYVSVSGNKFTISIPANEVSNGTEISLYADWAKYYNLLEIYSTSGSYQKVVDPINGVTDTTILKQTTTSGKIKIKSCDAELESLGENPTVEQLISLYYNLRRTFPIEDYRNLLNFDGPSCGKPENCDYQNIGCLSATIEKNNFNENNLSCYGEFIHDEQGNYIFCALSYSLTNNIGTSNFYGNAGKMLIKQDNNTITIYESNGIEKIINSNYIATSTTTKHCYIYKTASVASTYLYNGKNVSEYYTTYFGDNNDDGVTEELEVVNQSGGYYSGGLSGDFNYYKYSLTKNYSLNEMYLEKITGKYTDTKNNKTTDGIKGILSKFNSTTGTIPFKIDNDESNACEYELTPQIIKYTPGNPNGKLQLEFRVINTSNPFVGKDGTNRNTKTNWCYLDDCSYNNKNVQDYIINATNSNATKDKVKYKITLTPSDIQNIRKYNAKYSYDNYEIIEITENNETKKVNRFLNDLRNKEIKIYDNDGEVINIYPLSNQLQ